MDFHTPVAGPAPLAVIGGNGLPLTAAAGFDAAVVDAEIHQSGANRVRATFGEALVVVVGADGVGMADNIDGEAGIAVERLRQVPDHGFELITHVGAVERKGDVGRHGHDNLVAGTALDSGAGGLRRGG